MMTAGEIAIAALAQLDAVTMVRDWHKQPKVRKQIRFIINTAHQRMKNEVCQCREIALPSEGATDPLTKGVIAAYSRDIT